MRKFSILLLLASGIFNRCTVSKLIPESIAINSLKYLGSYEIPYNHQYKGTTVGGLSGIDYDAKNDQYYIICDDRSGINPARFYTAKIKCTQGGISKVEFVNVTTLLKPDGKPYPDLKRAPDPEAMRYNTVKREFVWTSEGERIVTKEIIIEQPSITVINTEGKYIDTFPLAAQIRTYVIERGVRKNSSFEGLAFADNFKRMYVSVEEPLYEDGPASALQDAVNHTRIIEYDLRTRKPVAQYAYDLEPVAHAPVPANEFSINGITDILSVGKNKLLVVERSYSRGIQSNTIRVYIADLTNASDISQLMSLQGNSVNHPASKKLLINMDILGIVIDNIEGVTFGPDLPNGNKTLLFVSDNNFSRDQKTQFLLFEIN